MSFSEILKNIVGKFCDNMKLNSLEKEILKIHMVTKDEEKIVEQLKLSGIIIVKLNFSNGKFLCANKEILTKVTHFREIINDDNNDIIEINVVNDIDDYNLMTNIVMMMDYNDVETLSEDNKYDILKIIKNIKPEETKKLLEMIKFLYDGKIMEDDIVNNVVDDDCMDDYCNIRFGMIMIGAIASIGYGYSLL